MAMFDFSRIKRSFQNRWPGTKWPVQAAIFKPVGISTADKKKREYQPFFVGLDFERPFHDKKGNLIYVLKGTDEDLITPPPGVVDNRGNTILFEITAGEYRYATLKFDEASNDLIAHLHDDEQMKIIYSQNNIDTADRTTQQPEWYQTITFGIIVLAIFGFTVLLLISGQMNGAIGAINNAAVKIGGLTDVLTQVASSSGSAVSSAPV